MWFWVPGGTPPPRCPRAVTLDPLLTLLLILRDEPALASTVTTVVPTLSTAVARC